MSAYKRCIREEEDWHKQTKKMCTLEALRHLDVSEAVWKVSYNLAKVNVHTSRQIREIEERIQRQGGGNSNSGSSTKPSAGGTKLSKLEA